MRPFLRVTSRAAVLDRADVDTDQIIPKQFLKRIERTGYGEFLFFDWMKDPDFELHATAAFAPKILLAGRNFGCGSSREHAAWALQDAGFEVVIAPSFGDIFRTNALKTGVLPLELPEDEVRALMAADGELTVDLERQVVAAPDGREVPFELDAFSRMCLLEGLDDIGLALRHADAIEAYERANSPRVVTTAL